MATSHTSWLKTRRVLSMSLAILRDSISCLRKWIFGENVRVWKSDVKEKRLPEIDKSIVHLYDDNNRRI